MWLYLGSSCPNPSFSKELSDAEINTWIHTVLDHGADLNLRASPATLREGVASTTVSLFVSVFGSLCDFYPLIAFVTLHRASCMLAVRHRVSTYPRMRQSGRQTVPVMRSCGHGSREGRPRVPPIGWRGSRGRILPLNWDPRMRRKRRKK
jgi:hypothetical protein